MADELRRLVLQAEIDDQREAIVNFLEWWDILPGGHSYRPSEIEQWLNLPAAKRSIKNLRKIAGQS